MFIRLLLLLLVNAALSAYELSVVAMFRDESRYLKEWVDYHRLVGVEHFWLYNDHSKDNWQEVLQDYIDAGIVDAINWDEFGDDTYGYMRQPAIYKDGITRSIGNTKWLAIIDIDEFIVPMKDMTIIDCLNNNYPKETKAIYINWRNFGTSGITVPEGGSILYHLTSCSLPSHPKNVVGKCIVRPECINLETLWTPHHFDLFGGTPYYDGSAKLLPKNKEGTDFKYDQKHSAKFLRVNHYALRDEYFYWNFRYPRCLEICSQVLSQEQYHLYNLVKDIAIQRFLEKLYPNNANIQ